MQNSLLNKINASVKIILLILLTLSILISKSLYLIIFFTILILMLYLIVDESVKYYIDSLENISILLLFAFIIYIIVFGGILSSLIFLYKLLLIIFLIVEISLSFNIQNLGNGIKTLLQPFSKNISDKFICNIICFIFYVTVYFNSKKVIMSKYKGYKRFKYTFSLKYNILPRIFYSMKENERLRANILIKSYKLNKEKLNIESKMLLTIFIILFIVVIIKEVIL